MSWIRPRCRRDGGSTALKKRSGSASPRRRPVIECLEERSLLSGAGVTEFSSGFTGHPSGLTSGPDGNLYFGEQFNDRIGVFSLQSKQATEIQLPAGTGPHNLAADPINPNLVWFSAEFDKLGSLNIHTKQVTLYADGISPRSKPDFLAFDTLNPNFIWFSEQLGG